MLLVCAQMLAFKFRGTVADVDGTVEGEPHHPTKVLLVDSVEKITRVILPKDVLDVGADLLTIGQRIEV